ncbi:bis(5'-nucleosyl)-tetraphosphatase (symmetrical) YqeK [Hominifimenecus sp. rT4P-3]|uniref:bis(5'-nucleosyl)-tetraphosphatase (symmetrical) YqeK n=1 Tax=Hominifimenecus sp. rT4P-3 TaxID=3242979 RepID=UPI003DA2B5B3
MNEQEICQKLQHVLKPERYQHTLGVADTAVCLAKVYGASPIQARLAGLLHDCGKEAGDALGHAAAGAWLAETEYGITDSEILSAIRFHTTGKPAMSLLEKIIFVADYIEPGRDRAPRLLELRKLAYQDLDQTVLLILEDTFAYLNQKQIPIDERSQATYQYYLKRKEHRMDDSKKMTAIAYEALDEKKAAEITVIDITKVSTIADYFLITNGENSSHVQALVENVQEKMGRAGYPCKSVEGFRAANWVLLDYGDIVVNVFSKEDRRFYDLERIWRDGTIIENVEEWPK